MKHSLFRRGIALLLVLVLCGSCFPAAVFAADGEAAAETRAEQTERLPEDAAVQLGAYTPPAEQPEPEAPETAAPETEAPVTAAPVTEAAETEPERTVTPPQPLGEAAANEGRASADQQVLTVDGTDYILIGTKQQLQALDYYPTTVTGQANNDELTESRRYDVTGPIWRVRYTRSSYLSSWNRGEAELVYPGDNNLVGDICPPRRWERK